MKRLLALVVITIAVMYAENASAGLIVKAPPYIGLNEGLVGYWSFDGGDMAQGGGNPWALDRSGNGNHGELTNGPIQTIGRIGQALEFDGVDDYVDVNGFAEITGYPFTLSAWVITDDTDDLDCGTYNGALTIERSATEYFSVGCGNSEWGIVGRNTSFTRQLGSSFNTGVWTHITGVFRSATDRELYINGKFDVQDTSSVPELTNADTVSIGKRGGDSGYWNGLIDETRIYNRALSADEIKRLYKIGSTFVLNKPRTDTLDEGLVGYWSFDGADMSQSTNNVWALDRSGQGNNGVLKNTATSSVRVPGRIGQALEFDGSDDYVDVGDIDDIAFATTDFTISAWININDLTTDENAIICRCDTSGNGDIVFRVEKSGNLSFSTLTSAFKETSSNIQENNWYHAVVVFTEIDTDATFYLDGQSLPNDIKDQALSAVGNSPDPTSIGLRSDGPFDPFNGLIDEVRVYNRALSADEIKRLYKIGSTFVLNKPRTDTLNEGLVGYWSFDGVDMAQGGNNPWALDRSGNGNHGELTNGPIQTIGRIGQALEFDGVDDYVNAGSDTSLDDLTVKTVSFWIKPEDDSGNNSVMAKIQNTGASSTWKVNWDGTNKRVEIEQGFNSGNGGWGTPVNSFPSGELHHVAAIYDNSSASNDATIYIDGISQTITEYATPGGTRNSDASSPLTIGLYGVSFPKNIYAGLIDEVRVYDRALSSDEIRRLYNMGR